MQKNKGNANLAHRRGLLVLQYFSVTRFRKFTVIYNMFLFLLGLLCEIGSDVYAKFVIVCLFLTIEKCFIITLKQVLALKY
jgi:hypothetical protein